MNISCDRDFRIDYKEILESHDVVFKTPSHDATYGLPIGNGDVGCLLWTSENKINIAINKTDLWDDAPSPVNPECASLDVPWMDTPFIEGSENLTTCRHGASFTIDLNCPAFEFLYQEDFEARLSLYDGTAKISSKTPFIKTDVTAFVLEDKVAVIHMDVDSEDELPVSAKLERWGSRTMWFWYLFHRNDKSIGLSGTSSFADEKIIKIVQELNGTTFCVACLPVSDDKIDLKTMGKHTATAEAEQSKNHSLTYYISVATGENKEDASKKAEKLVMNASKKGYEKLYSEHSGSWADFWSKSFVSLPTENDYRENLWYLNLYYANSSMKGEYPSHFCNGLWGFYHDFVPWNHFFHYNMQHACHPLDAANHPELLKTYYNFRINQLPMAENFAKKYKNSKGAFYCDICDRLGRNDVEAGSNFTPGAQIAMMLYTHYLYTGDKDFFKKALPVMESVAEFYIDKLKKDENGFYRISESLCYEGSPLYDDSITDYVMIEVLFKALIKEKNDDKYKEVLGNLFPYKEVTLPMYPDEYKNGKFLHGIGKGYDIKGEDVLAIGRLTGTNELKRRTFGERKNDTYGFPDIEMSLLFPSGNIGIKDEGSKIFDLVYNSVCLHAPCDENSEDGKCMQWCMEPIYLARMGLSDLLDKYIENTINTWMIYPQGFGADCPDGLQVYQNPYDSYLTENDFTHEKASTPKYNFRHFDYETLPIISTAINEMLLQSFDGTVRLFPAVRNDKSYAFSLMAQGGFKVEAIYNKGEFFAKITSLRGEKLSLAFEKVNKVIFKTEIPFAEKEGVYEFDTCTGDEIYAYSTEKKVSFDREYIKNNQVKLFRDVKLGS